MSVSFDEGSARRIAGAVRRVEGTPLDRRPVGRGQSAVGGVAPVYVVVSAARDGSSWRWAYTVKRGVWDGTYGWSGTGDALPARNLIEAGNGTSGTVSGIELDEDVVGIEPVPNGTPVFAWPTYADGGDVCHVFQQSNAPKISCGDGSPVDSSGGETSAASAVGPYPRGYFSGGYFPAGFA